jgi:positive phototaxis protein PixI
LNLGTDRHARRSSSLVESAPTQQQFLRFTILPDLVALMAIDAQSQQRRIDSEVPSELCASRQRRQQVTELIDIPLDRVVPMPHLPPTVMGVYNWRGEILWIVDLAKLLGLDTPTGNYRSLQPTIVLTSSGDNDGAAGDDRFCKADAMRTVQTIGLVVDAIAEIEWYALETTHIPAPEQIYAELRAWARGVWQSVTGENFLVLDGQAILERADFQADV